MNLDCRTVRYVVHGDVEKFQGDGWEVVSQLSLPHSQYAVLMEKKMEVEFPVLIVPHDDGVLVKVKGQTAIKKMTAKQMMDLAVELIMRANRRHNNDDAR
tara:strand:+ start:323 stop:622 length:300 start_codon:yes stop_codon:yes gene_type:complete